MKIDQYAVNNSAVEYIPNIKNNENVVVDKIPSLEVKDAAAVGTDLLNYVKLHPDYIPSVGEKTFIQAVEEANKKLAGANTEFRFSIHEKTKQISVKIINTETKEVIREIPPEKILDLVAKLCEQAGLLVDEKR